MSTQVPLLAYAVALVALPIFSFLGFYFWATPNSLKDSRRRHLPPGPRGLPFLGNYLELSKPDTFRFHVQKWARQYGEIFYTRVGGSDYIWLSSPRLVSTLR